MKCAESLELLSEYHDSALDGALASQVRAHLNGCPPCAAIYQDITRIVLMATEISSEPQIEFPDSNVLWHRLKVSQIM
jgi:predicted anti-sigma-YlaC factor YlaD